LSTICDILQFVDKYGSLAATAMPQSERGPCQGPGDAPGTLCGQTWSTCWYGAARKGIHFCSHHRRAFEASKQNGAATEEAEDATELAQVDELLGTRYCEPSRMQPKQRRNTVGKSTLQYCVQGTFCCDEDDERGETDVRWQTVDELVEVKCSREDFNELCAKHMQQLKKTMVAHAKRFKTAAEHAQADE